MSPRESADPRLGRAIRLLREGAGMTQEDVAYHAGISTGSLSRIECALANPSWTTVTRIVAALDASLRELADTMEGLPGR
ncbi:MAG: helix-turn-helix domain-containing protein [Solirubrobacteraceae bacterium]